MERMVALLRAVNVGGRKLPMAELRALGEEIGWSDVSTYIQSGNLVFAGSKPPAELEVELERAIAQKFGMTVPAIVRTARQWRDYPLRCPFTDEATREPNRVMILLSKKRRKPLAEQELQRHAADGERVKTAGDAVWIHFPAGSARSRLTPTLIDRVIGSASTARNYRTVVKLQEMLSA